MNKDVYFYMKNKLDVNKKFWNIYILTEYKYIFFERQNIYSKTVFFIEYE